jgi:hypothetical protein
MKYYGIAYWKLPHPKVEAGLIVYDGLPDQACSGEKMNRRQLKEIFEGVGLFSIVATLVFVGLEIRQNTDAFKSATILSVTQMSNDGIALVLGDGNLRAALRASDIGTPNFDQSRQVKLYYTFALNIQLNRFLQSDLGLIDRETVLALGGRATLYERPDFRRHWAVVKHRYPPAFQDYMENEVLIHHGE